MHTSSIYRRSNLECVPVLGSFFYSLFGELQFETLIQLLVHFGLLFFHFPFILTRERCVDHRYDIQLKLAENAEKTATTTTTPPTILSIIIVILNTRRLFFICRLRLCNHEHSTIIKWTNRENLNTQFTKTIVVHMFVRSWHRQLCDKDILTDSVWSLSFFCGIHFTETKTTYYLLLTPFIRVEPSNVSRFFIRCLCGAVFSFFSLFNIHIYDASYQRDYALVGV